MEGMMNDYIGYENTRIEAEFYSIQDVMKMTGWGEATVQNLFNDPAFPYTDFGKHKLIEKHALIKYFSTGRRKSTEKYWVRKGKANVKQRA